MPNAVRATPRTTTSGSMSPSPNPVPGPRLSRAWNSRSAVARFSVMRPSFSRILERTTPSASTRRFVYVADHNSSIETRTARGSGAAPISATVLASTMTDVLSPGPVDPSISTSRPGPTSISRSPVSTKRPSSPAWTINERDPACAYVTMPRIRTACARSASTEVSARTWPMVVNTDRGASGAAPHPAISNVGIASQTTDLRAICVFNGPTASSKAAASCPTLIEDRAIVSGSTLARAHGHDNKPGSAHSGLLARRAGSAAAGRGRTYHFRNLSNNREPRASTTMAMNILIADDDKVHVHLLTTLLKRRGFGVAVAYDGLQAWSTALRTMPDAILLDIHMPAGTGFEVLRKLKTSSKTSQ